MNTRALVAEAIGTVALVFVGTGAMAVDVVTRGGHVGILFAFGVIVYFGAPLLGAWIAVRACRLVRGEDCCPAREIVG